MVEFYARNDAKESENNLKLQGCPSDLQYTFKNWSQINGMSFMSTDSTGITEDFHSRLIEVTTHPSDTSSHGQRFKPDILILVHASDTGSNAIS